MKSSVKEKSLKLMLVAFGVATVLVGTILVYFFISYISDRSLYDSVKKTAVSSTGDHPFSEDMGPLVDFDALSKINPDTVGWIAACNGKIEGPIVQTVDNDYYLTHRIDGKSGNAGTIFADYRSLPAFSTPVTVLYGHNMKDGSMFHPLLSYRDEEYFKENPYFTIYTPDGEKTYRVFSAFCRNYDDIPGIGYAGCDIDRKTAADIIEKAKKLSAFRADPDVDTDGFSIKAGAGEAEIVILYTCDNSDEDSRMVVYGVYEAP